MKRDSRYLDARIGKAESITMMVEFIPVSSHPTEIPQIPRASGRQGLTAGCMSENLDLSIRHLDLATTSRRNSLTD